VLSLLALLFTYDAIAGERETGTMRLTMSHPVRRGNILAAKYLGAMTCLILPLIMSLTIALIWMDFNAVIVDLLLLMLFFWSCSLARFSLFCVQKLGDLSNAIIP